MSWVRSALRTGLSCLVLLCGLGHCAPLQAAGKDPVTYALKLEPNADIAAGKIAIVQGEAGREPDHYVVENLTILQPVQVTLITKDPSDEVKIQLCKHLWGQPEKEGTTQGKGSVHFAFRTEGDLRIQVLTPGKPCAYQLAVWAGDALQRPVPSAFVPMAAASKSPVVWLASPVLWLIAGLLFLIFVMLLVLVVRGRRR